MSKVVLTAFEEYQKERVKFVQTIAEMSTQPKNVEGLQAAGVMKLLRPLLLDNVSSIQQSAALALARLAGYSEEIAEAIVANQILTQLVDSLSRQNRFYKKAAAYVLKSVAQHSDRLAQCVIDAGALEALVNCLEEFDPNVKEGAAYALGCIAKHSNAALAAEVAKAGAIEHLSICIQDPEANLKKVATNTLCEIAKHNPELASKVAAHPGTLKTIAGNLVHRDLELRQNSCTCLANIAKHNETTAGQVLEAGIFPDIITFCIKEEKPGLRKHAIMCIQEICGQSKALATIVVDKKCIDPLVEYLGKTKGAAKLPAVMALGFISGFDQALATKVVQAKGHQALVSSLKESKDDHIKAAIAWSLGQIGKHTTELGNDLAKEHALEMLLKTYLYAEENSDLHKKTSGALQSMIEKCKEMAPLTSLLKEAPGKIILHVVTRIHFLLKENKGLMKEFADNGSLSKLQEILKTAEGPLKDAIKSVNDLFPPDVVKYFTQDILVSMITQEEDLYKHD